MRSAAQRFRSSLERYRAAREGTESASTVSTLCLTATSALVLLVPLVLRAGNIGPAQAAQNPVYAGGAPVPRYALIDFGTNFAPAGINNSNMVVGNIGPMTNGATGGSGVAIWSWSSNSSQPLPINSTYAAYGISANDYYVVGIDDAGNIAGNVSWHFQTFPLGLSYTNSWYTFLVAYWANSSTAPVALGEHESSVNGQFDPLDSRVSSISDQGYMVGAASYEVQQWQNMAENYNTNSMGSSGNVAQVLYPPAPYPPSDYGTNLPCNTNCNFFSAGGATNWCGQAQVRNNYTWANYPVINGTIYTASAYTNIDLSAINDTNIAVGSVLTNSIYTAVMVRPLTGAALSVINLGPGRASYLNNHLNTNGAPAPQIIGGDTNNIPMLWDQTTPSGSPAIKPLTGNYVGKTLTSLLSNTNNWSMTTVSGINNLSSIIGTATYTQTGPTDPIPAGVHGAMLISAELSVDANRDGTIVLANDASNPNNVDAFGKPLPVDTTSQTKPYRFWLNSFDESNEQDNPDSTTQDSASTTIVDERDLENFSRLWIYNNVPSGFFGSTKVQFGLKWKSVTGTPSIRLFHAYETDGGAKYVADENTASNQALGVTKSCLLDKSNLSVVASTGAAADFIFADGPDNNYSTTNSEQHFLFEGVGVGKGELVPVYLDSTGKEIGEGPGVWLDLENIKTMYKSSDADQFVQAWDETKQAIIFVHGWQMSPNGSRTFAEDMFKRLWHRGYKGRFCYFRWDTGNSNWFGNYVPVIGQDIDSYLANFNGSEHTAWHSGQALNTFIGSAVPSGYSKNLVAHSMGNIVAGSGFLNGLTVSHYAMLQAAVPSCCYDSSTARQQTTTSVVSYDVAGVNLNVTLWANPTPDNDPDPATQALAYRGRLASYGANNFYSFYQPDDEATQYYWEGNNAHFKPDSGFFGLAYYYSYTRSGSAGHKLAYSVAGGAQSSWVTDPLEAMPYADQSWSKAAGADAGTGGAVTGGVNNETAYDFGSDHSAEFIMDVQGVETTFYHDLLNSMQIPQNPNP